MQETHDAWWARRRELAQARKQEFDEKRSAWQSRKAEKRERLAGNIEKNRAKLEKAADALERQRNRADEIRIKIATSRSEKWSEIFEQWLTECEDKIESIEETIRRFESWIEEDLERLRNLDD